MLLVPAFAALSAPPAALAGPIGTELALRDTDGAGSDANDAEAYRPEIPESDFEWNEEKLEAARRRIKIRNLTAALLNAYTYGQMNLVPNLQRELETLDPDGAWTHYFRALAAHDREKRGEAMVHCDEALRKDPGLSRAWNLKGLLLLDADRAAEARDAFQRAVEHNPYSPNHSYNLAAALHRLGANEDALLYARRAVELRANFSEALYLESLLLHRLERSREAVAAIAAAREYGMDGQRFYLDYLRIARAAENDEGLVIAVKELAGSDDPLILRELGRVHLYFGEFEAAAARLRKLAPKPEADMNDWKDLVRAVLLSDGSVIAELRRMRLEPEQRRELLDYYQELRAVRNQSLQPREPVVNSKWRLMHD